MRTLRVERLEGDAPRHDASAAAPSCRDLVSTMDQTDWIAMGSIAAAVTALGTVAMAIAIVWTAVIASRTLTASREDSRARTRPIVVAELRRELLSKGTTLLVIRNLGQSVASNVVVAFDPPPPDDPSSLPDADMHKWIFQRYATPVATWAPGWTLSNVIRAGHDELAPITVNVSYAGPGGAKYSDAFALHPDHILKETTSGPGKTSDPVKMEQEKLEVLRALVRTIRAS